MPAVPDKVQTETAANQPSYLLNASSWTNLVQMALWLLCMHSLIVVLSVPFSSLLLAFRVVSGCASSEMCKTSKGLVGLSSSDSLDIALCNAPQPIVPMSTAKMASTYLQAYRGIK